jgi:hypothetical protein
VVEVAGVVENTLGACLFEFLAGDSAGEQRDRRHGCPLTRDDIPDRVADEDGALGIYTGPGQRYLDDVRLGLRGIHILGGSHGRHQLFAVENLTENGQFVFGRRGRQHHLQAERLDVL